MDANIEASDSSNHFQAAVKKKRLLGFLCSHDHSEGNRHRLEECGVETTDSWLNFQTRVCRPFHFNPKILWFEISSRHVLEHVRRSSWKMLKVQHESVRWLTSATSSHQQMEPAYIIMLHPPQTWVEPGWTTAGSANKNRKFEAILNPQSRKTNDFYRAGCGRRMSLEFCRNILTLMKMTKTSKAGQRWEKTGALGTFSSSQVSVPVLCHLLNKCVKPSRHFKTQRVPNWHNKSIHFWCFTSSFHRFPESFLLYLKKRRCGGRSRVFAGDPAITWTGAPGNRFHMLHMTGKIW